jgi:nucleotide-binding universal stress UspA family protein
MKPEILIGTNGFEGTWPGIEYAAWLGQNLGVPVALVGILEEKERPNIDEESHPLQAIFSRAVELFQESDLEYHLEIHEGHAEEIIPKIARARDYLTILTPLGRPPLRRLLLRRSFHQLMANITGPILYVPSACIPPSRILVCLGGLGYGRSAEALGLEIASKVNAPVSIMHVVPPIDLDYPEARAVQENWEHLEESDTISGRNLRQGLELARKARLTVDLKIRQGNVVEQIVEEVNQGGYDLVCMGSPYSTQGLRQLYAPNITAEVAEAIGFPVLTVRFQSGQA